MYLLCALKVIELCDFDRSANIPPLETDEEMAPVKGSANKFVVINSCEVWSYFSNSV